MISARQIKAARALLGINQEELATKARLGLATVRRIEASIDRVVGTVQSLVEIKRTLERAGIVFIDQDDRTGPGVRLKHPIK